MTDDRKETALGENRGAVVRLFGVILIILGTLNTMLSWRGGFEVVPFHAMLIGTGLLLCLIGSILRGNRR